MSTIMTASRQWATRPDDERFVSLTELNRHCQNIRQRSASRVVSSRRLEAAPLEGTDNKGLVAYDPRGNAHDITHWAFGQLANRAGAPPGYLRDLPAPLAADCINYGLRFHRDVEELGVLTTEAGTVGELATLRAVTGPNYGRIWNATITQALVDRFGDGINGEFRVPGEFGKRVEVTKANTTLYASDRDMFVFLADEERRIEIPNRRNGQNGSLARGFLVWNSEVGDTTLGFAMFLFDYVCSNRIIWGAQEYVEKRVRHSAGAPDRWIEEISPTIHAYANASTTGIVDTIALAQQKKVDDVDAFLKSRRYTNAQATGVKAAFLADEQRPMETLWDVSTGITAYARAINTQSDRVRLEREAGRILDLAA